MTANKIMDKIDAFLMIVLFLFCTFLDFVISDLLEFNPHLSIAALIFASTYLITKKLNNSNENKSEEHKQDKK